MRGYRFEKDRQQQKRSGAISLVVILNILAYFAVIGLMVALVMTRMSRGVPLLAQAADLAAAVLGGLFLVWIQWGTWELDASSWWAHLTVGPVLVAGMLFLFGAAPEAAKLILHDMKRAEVEQAVPIIRGVAGAIGALEVLTILAVLGERKAFQIGRKKELWERR